MKWRLRTLTKRHSILWSVYQLTVPCSNWLQSVCNSNILVWLLPSTMQYSSHHLRESVSFFLRVLKENHNVVLNYFDFLLRSVRSLKMCCPFSTIWSCRLSIDWNVMISFLRFCSSLGPPTVDTRVSAVFCCRIICSFHLVFLKNLTFELAQVL